MFDFLPAIYQEPEWRPPNPKEDSVCPICGQRVLAAEVERGSQELDKTRGTNHKSHLREFLEAFEKVLLGFDNYDPPLTKPSYDGDLDSVIGLGQKIERLHELFDPYPDRPKQDPKPHPAQTPARFLPWLASFAALSLPAGMSEVQQRKLTKVMISLYGRRGTKEYLETLLKMCLDVPSSVSEEEIPPMQLGVNHQVGVDTYIGGGPPHFFSVTLYTGGLDGSSVEAHRQLAYEVIELAKPAHTTYELTFASPRMQIGIHSTIGLDTVLSPAAA
jgi:phage tail-like protein